MKDTSRIVDSILTNNYEDQTYPNNVKFHLNRPVFDRARRSTKYRIHIKSYEWVLRSRFLLEVSKKFTPDLPIQRENFLFYVSSVKEKIVLFDGL